MRCVKNMPTNLTFYLIEKFNLQGGAKSAVIVGGVLLCMIIPYLLGSFNFGLIISKKKYNDDIRTHGSGNAGTTNMLRTYGKRAAILTLLGDMLKAAVAVAIGYLLADINTIVINPETADQIPVIDHYGAAIAGLFVMLGHMFPIFYKFKGGKGVATSAMVVLMISPISFLFCFLTFVIIVVGTKFVSLASCFGMILYPIILKAFSGDQNPVAQITAVLMATLVVFMHRENLKRLLEGTESKLYFSKKKREAAAAEAAARAAKTAYAAAGRQEGGPAASNPSAAAPRSAASAKPAGPDKNTSKKKQKRKKK